MKIITTPLEGLLIIEPDVFEDQRGYFFESYNQKKYTLQGINYHFVQDNQSESSFGTIRGLHFQMEPKAQTKLVRVLTGSVFDVAVDVRKGSPTYGKWFGMKISGDNKKQLLIPKGFAHGFSVLSEKAVVFYKCDEFYSPEHDSGIRFDDPALNIDWRIAPEKYIISEKDKKLTFLKDTRNNFTF